MKRRIKLLSSIFSLTLAFAFMSYGVYAAAARQAAVTGSLSFSSESVYATIIVSTAVGTGSYSKLGADIVFDGSSQGGTTAQDKAISTVAFTDTSTTFKYKVDITITASTRPANIAFVETRNNGHMPSGVNRAGTVKIGTAAAETITFQASSNTTKTENAVPVGTLVTYEFTYTLPNPQSTANFDATQIINSTFTLTRVTS